MSRWSDRDSFERREEERREYRADVFYEAWRRGIDPDRASECASDCYYDGRSASECVDGTAAQIRREREARQEREYEEERQMAAEYERQRELAEEQEQPDPIDSAPPTRDKP